MKVKSNRYKCRNLPTHYSVNQVIKAKPVFAMLVFFVIGFVMLFHKNYWYMGAFFCAIGGYTLFFTKNNVAVEFSDDFMVVYLDDKSDECYLIYYDEVDKFQYQAKMYETDIVRIFMKNKKIFEFKSLDRRRLKKNLNKYLLKTESDRK